MIEGALPDPFKTELEKAQEMDFSRPLDVHKWSEFPQVNAVVSAIYTDLKKNPDFTINERLKEVHIKVIALNLYVAWLRDPDWSL